jgi:hypothetical protein
VSVDAMGRSDRENTEYLPGRTLGGMPYPEIEGGKGGIMRAFQKFKELHHQDTPLLMGNAWDVKSALIMQSLGFRAIGTSSAAIAASQGYQDGEGMPFKDLVKIVRSIQLKLEIPLTVDIEGGFSRDIDEVCANVKSLADLGVVVRWTPLSRQNLNFFKVEKYTLVLGE